MTLTARAAGPEVHIAGVLVHARPDSLTAIRSAVSRIPKAEVTHQSEDGRLVAVLEAASGGEIVQQMEAIRLVPGVLNVALVYQQAEAQEDMNKEIQA